MRIFSLKASFAKYSAVIGLSPLASFHAWKELRNVSSAPPVSVQALAPPSPPPPPGWAPALHPARVRAAAPTSAMRDSERGEKGPRCAPAGAGRRLRWVVMAFSSSSSNALRLRNFSCSVSLREE